jgi:hypothetical protein
MTDPKTPLTEQIKDLEEEADELEDHATRDAILPDEVAKGDGVGSVTGLVP